jgi:hypothetical protein
MSTQAISKDVLSRVNYPFINKNIQHAVLHTLHFITILSLILPNFSVFIERTSVTQSETVPTTDILDPTGQETVISVSYSNHN